MKRTLKRFGAFALSIAMVLSMFTGLAPAAQAAGERAPTANEQAAADNLDAGAGLTGKPRLYVDFLGDNDSTTSGVPSVPDQVRPADDTWRYDPANKAAHVGKVFWVGVGLDRLNALKLAQGGFDSVELGFYYDPKYVQPYTGPGGDFMAVLEQYNIGSAIDQSYGWGGDYELVTAVAAADPVLEPVTQEVNASYPTNEDIQAQANGWKMVYAALERKAEAPAGPGRFATTQDPFDVNDETQNDGGRTHYVMLIPFVLRDCDSQERLCFRLARNATAFSIGGVTVTDGGYVHDGATSYGAWERVTTRNPGRELKLMTNFTGDLNIFKGSRDIGTPLSAELHIKRGGGSDNKVELGVTDDPSAYPVTATEHMEKITGLYGGTGMTVKVSCDTNYTATVTVRRQSVAEDQTEGYETVTVVGANQDYRFVMPEEDVIVTVTFAYDTSAKQEFKVKLREDRTEEDPDDGTLQGNFTTITTVRDAGVTEKTKLTTGDIADDPDAYALSLAAKTVKIQAEAHGDYDAIVTVQDPDGLYTLPDVDNTKYPRAYQLDTDGDGELDSVYLPAGVEEDGCAATFTMPGTDAIVTVKYVPAKVYQAGIKVSHAAAVAADAPHRADDLAQLSYPGRAVDDTVETRYSALVREGDTPVVDPFRVLTALSAASAAQSGSHGGDGTLTTGLDLPRLLGLATGAMDSPALLGGELSANDLNALDLRKNVAGDQFTAADLTGDGGAFALLAGAMQAAKEAGAESKTGTLPLPDDAPEGTAPETYRYYDITKDQLQVYLAQGQYMADADARTAVAGYYWNKTWTDTDPLHTEDPFIQTRDGRTVAVTVECNSRYMVKEVKVTPAASAPAGSADVTARKDVTCANRYTFEMPAYDVDVEVIYTLRPQFDVTLNIIGAGGAADNKALVSGFQAGDGITPKPVSNSVNGQPISVFSGSVVTVKVNKDSGYTAKVSVKDAEGGVVQIVPNKTTDLADGTVFTFPMPASAVSVDLTYEKKEVKVYTAQIGFSHLSGYHADDTAFWDEATRTGSQGSATTAVVHYSGGNALGADITVAPGYYVYRAAAASDEARYAVALDGNGYNNGAGGTVHLDMTMPEADVTVKVIFAKGPPSSEPELGVTLKVEDPDDPAFGSWADLQVDGGANSLPVNGAISGGVTVDAHAGDTITVDLHPAEGYYAASAVVTPQGYRVSPEWVDEDTLRFPMPAGDAQILVTYRKIPVGGRPTYGLDLDKTEDPADEGAAENTVLSVTTATLTAAEGSAPHPVGYLPAQVAHAAHAGEGVSLAVQTAPGWRIRSISIRSGGTSIDYTPKADGWFDGAGGTVDVGFAMPNGDADVTVRYAKGAPPASPEYGLTLRVEDPDNALTGDPAALEGDNWAAVQVNGEPQSAKVRKDGALTVTVHAGDRIIVHYESDAAFSAGAVTVQPGGLGVVPVRTGGQTAVFTMPAADADVTVPFRKGPADKYMANLILRPPAGVEVSQVGKGSFGVDWDALDDPLYAVTAQPGETVPFRLLASAGYYIDAVTVTPAALGVEPAFSGAIAFQNGSFVMPQADVLVNVWFKAGWPDEVHYNTTVKVSDPDRQAGNFARLMSEDAAHLGHGASAVTANPEKTNITVYLDTAPGYIADLSVREASGKTVAYSWADPRSITFAQPPSHVTVEVSYRLREPTDYTVTLHVSGAAGDKVTLQNYRTNEICSVTLSGGQTEGEALLPAPTRAGHEVIVSSSAGAGRHIQATLVMSGGQLMALQDPVVGGPSEQFNYFLMPEGDVDVYVYFADGPEIPASEPYAAALTVTAPAGTAAGAAGSGVIEKLPEPVEALSLLADDPLPKVTVPSNGGTGYINVGEKDTVQVSVPSVSPGYNVQAIRLTPVGSSLSYAVPFVWVDSKTVQFEMPAQAVAVEVVLDGGQPPTYKVQVVVNDTAYTGTEASRNTATVRPATETDPTQGGHLIEGLSSGDKLKLDLGVAPGYKVETFTTVPGDYQGAAVLPDGERAGQTVDLAMPAEDLVIYVQFLPDNLTRYNATLYIESDGTVPAESDAAYCWGTIQSPFSGSSDEVRLGGSATVLAAEKVEWVTVDYAAAPGCGVKDIQVTDATGSPVPFTQVGPNQLKLPMVPTEVKITVTFGAGEPKGYDAVLHVISADVVGQGYGRLAYAPAAQDTGKVYTGNTATIQVPAGETVDLTAEPFDGCYIKAAYVLSQGQMIECNLTAFTGPQTTGFQMHPAVNDVYVYLARGDAPDPKEFASVLMVSGPDETGLPARTKAEMTRTRDGVTTPPVTALSNGEHRYLTATRGDRITVTVTPAEGMAIDSILLTPLGIDLPPERGVIRDLKQEGNVYTFTMPACNVAAHIKMKTSLSSEYTATLHVSPATGSSSGRIGYTDNGRVVEATRDGQSIQVPEGTVVDFSATVGGNRYVKYAYVMKGPEMVLLTDLLEGTVPTGGTGADKTVQFTMPGGNVDVYLGYASGYPPTDPWRTVVLVVTDEGTPPDIPDNSGNNAADLTSTPADPAVTPVHATVSSDGKTIYAYSVKAGDEIEIAPGDPAAGYAYDKTTASASALPAPTLAGTDPGPYTFPMPDYNAAVHVHYNSTTVTEKKLTVVAQDADNPGNGTVTNTTHVAPDGMTPLDLHSTTSAGAKQIIHGMEADAQVDFAATPHTGYRVEKVTLTTGTGAAAVTETLTTTEADGVWSGSFVMPNKDAKLTVTYVRGYTATLRISDASGVAGTAVTLAGAGQSARDDGEQLVALKTGDRLTTEITPAPGVTVTAVLATGGQGTACLTGADHPYLMPGEDVTITVVLDKTEAKRPWVAAVDTANGEGLPKNTATGVVNTTDAALARGSVWASGYEDHVMEASFTTDDGWYATVIASAVNADGSAGAPLDVLQLGVTGGGRAYVAMPDSNVRITVVYSTDLPQSHELTARLTNAGGQAGNKADITNTAPELHLYGSAESATETGTATAVAGTALALAAGCADGYQLLSAKLSVGGVSVDLPLTNGAGGFQMPNSNAVLTLDYYRGYDVTLAVVDTAGTNGSSAELSANGHTMNVGANASNTMTPLPDATATNTTVNAGGGRLVGVTVTDDRTGSTAILTDGGSGYGYTVDGANATITAVVESADKTSLLAAVTLAGDYAAPGNGASVANGSAPRGSIWTTAQAGDRVTITVTLAEGYQALVSYDDSTLPSQVLTGSGDQSFTMPANNVTATVEFVRGYTATLVVRDESGVPGNDVSLAHGTDSVTAGGVLAGLDRGDGLSTTVTLSDADKVRVSAVTVTGPGGTTTAKSPYAITMPEGDIIVTVVLTAKDDADPEVLPTYVATLVQSGGTADPDNALTGMSNLTEPAMAGGDFWTAGHEHNTLRGTFTTAEGWYAKVSAVAEDGTAVPVLQQDTAGACTVGLAMPGQNVTVTVTYTQEKPDSTHKLTLNITGHDGQAGNNATLTTADGQTAYVEGAKVGDTQPYPDISKVVDAAVGLGVDLDLSANWQDGYKIKEVNIVADGVKTVLDPNFYGSNATVLLFMPDADAVVNVVYEHSYKATLVYAEKAVTANGATMTNDQDDRALTVEKTKKTDTLDLLSDGTMTTTTPTSAATGTRLQGVLLTLANGSSTTFIPEDLDEDGIGRNTYPAKIPSQDITVTAVYVPDTASHPYIAAVGLTGDAVGEVKDAQGSSLGRNTAAIAADPAGDPKGDIWTTADKGNQLTVTVTLAKGYQAFVSAVQADGTEIVVPVTPGTVAKSGGKVTFTMPEANVQVTVKFVKGYTATLRIHDVTNIPGDDPDTRPKNTAQLSTVMSYEDDGTTPKETQTVTKDGDALIALQEHQDITGVMDAVLAGELTGTDYQGAEIVSVVLTTSSGSRHMALTADTVDGSETVWTDTQLDVGQYDAKMPAEDVIVTVTFADRAKPDPDAEEPLYIAAVGKAGDDGHEDNAILNIVNQDADGLPRGDETMGEFWAGGYQTHRQEITFTTQAAKAAAGEEPGKEQYYAYVAAYRVDENGVVGAEIPVLQLTATGTADAPGKAYVTMPDSDVQVIVTYSTTAPPDVEVQLALVGHDKRPENMASLADDAPNSIELKGAAEADSYLSATFYVPDHTTAPGTALTIQTGYHPAYHIDSVRIVATVDGMSSMTEKQLLALPYVEVPLGATGGGVLDTPISGSTVLVYFATGAATPRPHDHLNAEVPADADAGTPKLEAGWLKARNQNDGEHVIVTVPVLAHEVEDESDPTKTIHVHEDTYVEDDLTTTETDESFEVRYVLYRYDGDNDQYVALVEGTDYALEPYQTATDTGAGYYAYGKYYAETIDGVGRQYTGSRFQLTALTEGIQQSFMDGDLFYITATKVALNTENVLEADKPESVKVQLVVPAAQAARPHDPEHHRTTTAPADPAETLLEEGWIYGVNYGDYSVITVPTLAWEEDLEPDANGVYQKEDVTVYGDTLTQRDDPDTPEDEGEAAVFHIWYQGPDGPVELELGTDIDLVPVDEADPAFQPGDLYNYGEYWSGTDPKTGDPRDYTGAKFRLELLEPRKNDDGTAGALSAAAQALADILDNQGSLDTAGRTSLYIQAEDKLGRRSQLVELVIRPYHSLEGTFVSYAPTHEATFSLCALDSGNGMDPGSYSAQPLAVSTVSAEEGTDLWRQSFAVKSSELLPQDGGKATYKLVIEKAGHITYTRVALELEKTDPDDTSGQHFTLYDEPRLIAGDITGRGKVKDQERTYLIRYIMDTSAWSQAADEGESGWDISIYNPDAFAYACDLDGNGYLGDADLRIMMDGANFNKTTDDYNSADGTHPHGLGTAPEVMLLEGEILPEEGSAPPEGLEPVPPEELIPPEEPAPPIDSDPPIAPEPPTEPDLPEEPESPSEPDEPEGPAEPPEEPGIIEPPLEPGPSAPPPVEPGLDVPKEDEGSPPDADIDSPEPDVKKPDKAGGKQYHKSD